MAYLLALDQGTTSSRALIFNSHGQSIAVAQKEFAQIFPEPGWVEHNAEEIWTTQSSVVTEVMAKAELSPADIAAVGITNQRETTVIWDRKTGVPIYNALVWQDRRTAALCDELKRQGLQKLVKSKTGLIIDAYFSASKIFWLLNNIPGARERAKNGELAFGTIDSWLIWKMTDGKRHVTEASNAARTMLYNIHSLQWDDELLNVFEIPRNLLPEVVDSSQVVGEYLGMPIAGIAGDQQAALFGQLCHDAGMVKNTYGTGCFMLMNTGEHPIESHNKLLTTIAWKIGDKVHYALEGSVFIAGAVVQWLRDGLHIIKKSSEIEALARSVSDTGGVYVVPAFTGLGAPHWDPHARGIICGLTRGTTSAHIARAALESIAFQVADILTAMEADAKIKLKELRVDGGACANDLLMQFQADLLGVPVVRPPAFELTALGAVLLAGLAVGVWKDFRELAAVRNSDRRFLPAGTEVNMAQMRAGWQQALARASSGEAQT